MEQWKKVFFILMVVMCLIAFFVFLPWMFPKAVKLYDWYVQGIDSIKDYLWDPNVKMFRESAKQTQSFWIDDQAKLLNVFLEDPERYRGNITQIIETLAKFHYEGYFPRRYVLVEPKITSMDTHNFEMENGFIRVKGDGWEQDPEKGLKLEYYEASSNTTICYLTGQSFIWDRGEYFYDWITYTPSRMQADQCNNPGFDFYSTPTESESSYNASLFIPWDFSRPKNWYSREDPPLSKNIYTCKFLRPKSCNYVGRVIGLKVNNEGIEYDWRSDKFQIVSNQTYTLSFRYYGTHTSGSKIRVFFRWFDSIDPEHWVGEYSVEVDSTPYGWISNITTCTTPAGYSQLWGDIRIVAYADTVAEFYFDQVQVIDPVTRQNLVPNSDFETPDGLCFSKASYHSRYRSARFYGASDYIKQYLVVMVPFANFKYIVLWSVATNPPGSLAITLHYSDGTSETVTKTVTQSEWNPDAKIIVSRSDFTPTTKGIEAFSIKQNSDNKETFIDDVAFVYTPMGGSFSVSYNAEPDPYNPGKYLKTELIQTFEDNYQKVNITFRFEKGKPYLIQEMTIYNKDIYTSDYFAILTLDELSTVYSGEGNRRNSYRSVWIPGVGRKYADPNSWITVFYDAEHFPEETQRWISGYDYFIFELMQIPEWSGNLGIVVKTPNKDALKILQSTRNDNTTLWGERTGEFLHYVTASFFVQGVSPSYSGLSRIQIFALNGYDWTDPAKLNYYLKDLDKWDNTDLSLNFHLGQIAYSLAKYFAYSNLDPYGMTVKTIRNYFRMFRSHNNGTYLMNAKMVEACLKVYKILGQDEFLKDAKYLADYLLKIQLADGRFPMPHNNVTYLDCQAICVYALNLMSGYKPEYKEAFLKGLNAIHWDITPTSSRHRIPVGGVGDNVPARPRLFVYANATHVDDDFWTYKASYVALASLGLNDTMTMLGLSRLWSRTIWNRNTKTLFVYNSESLPGSLIPGVDPEINSETHPWGITIWNMAVNYYREKVNYAWYFLENHYAIVKCSITKTQLNATVWGTNRAGTLAFFLCRGKGDAYVRPVEIRIDGLIIGNVSSIREVETANKNCYYYNEDAYDLRIKAIPYDPDYSKIFPVAYNLQILFDQLTIGMVMPILPILGIFGFVLMATSGVYGIEKIKNGEFLEGSALAMMFFIIGLGLVIVWLWSV